MPIIAKNESKPNKIMECPLFSVFVLLFSTIGAVYSNFKNEIQIKVPINPPIVNTEICFSKVIDENSKGIKPLLFIF